MASLPPEYVISGLVKRGVPLHAAQGVTARWTTESRLDPGINEINPTVEGSRGGFGLAQWTGPRRRQLEAFAAQRGVDPSDPETQLDFFMWENANTEQEAWAKTLAAKTPEEAAATFTTEWERPGIVNMGHTMDALKGITGLSDYAGGAQSGTYAPPGGIVSPASQPQAPVERNPLRLAWAYRNGKMSPQDAALYEKGMSQGVFQQPQNQADPLQIYSNVALKGFG